MKKLSLARKLPMVAAVSALTVGLGLTSLQAGATGHIEEGVCGPMDVVFVVDDTGSMGGAIGNIKTGIAAIAADVVTASGGNYQMGLVTFKDDVQTDVDLAAGNEAAVQAAVATLTASGGAGGPEASDAALDTVVNGTSAGSDGGPCNAPFASGSFRPEAEKIAIMLTDNFPGGCNDGFTAGIDDVNAARVAADASAADIKISAIYNSSSPNATILGVMTNYAVTTGGFFLNTPSDGSGTAEAISDIIAACGSVANECPLSQGYWKNHIEDFPVDSLTIGGIAYNAAALVDILQTPPKKGNSYLILGHQLIAALLNIENGSDPSVIDDELLAAEAALTGIDLASDYIKDDSLNELAGVLDMYNNQGLTPDCTSSGNED